jgi:hypothetical protein
MRTEVDKKSESDDSPPEISIKCEEPTATSNTTPTSTSSLSAPTTPLTTWPYSALLTPQSIISPSQLVLTDLIKRPASPSPSASAEPPAKKVKRKARTEEEKEVRAHERTMRNRRAAQESRDRKKRQFEVLEEENKRLLEENQQMKRRIELLEQRHQLFTITTPPTDDDVVIVKSEEEEETAGIFSSKSFESTFHSAAMKFNKDQQCHSISLKNYSRLFPFLTTICVLYHNQSWMMNVLLLRLFSTLFSLTTRISLMSNGMQTAYSPATFNSFEHWFAFYWRGE